MRRVARHAGRRDGEALLQERLRRGSTRCSSRGSGPAGCRAGAGPPSPRGGSLPQRKGTFCGQDRETSGPSPSRCRGCRGRSSSGARVASPFFTALPWRLSAYIFTMSPWQASQVGAACFSSCGSSFPERSEWQPTHGASAWTDFASRFSSTKSETVFPARFFVSVLSEWHSRQSEFSCAPAARARLKATRRANAEQRAPRERRGGQDAVRPRSPPSRPAMIRVARGPEHRPNTPAVPPNGNGALMHTHQHG